MLGLSKCSVPLSQWDEVLRQKQLHVAIQLVRDGKYHGSKNGGVGDRFTGMVTFFALALLNDVPFFMDYSRLHDAFVTGEGKLDWALQIEGKAFVLCGYL